MAEEEEEEERESRGRGGSCLIHRETWMGGERLPLPLASAGRHPGLQGGLCGGGGGERKIGI